MPSNVQSYNEWLSSAPQAVAVIDLLDIGHPAWGNFRIAKWGADVMVREESGSVQTYNAGFFELVKPPSTDTLENNTSVSISAMDGAIYAALNTLTDVDRETPITAVLRMVRSDGAVGGIFEELMVTPPPLWNVAQISVTQEAITADIRADPVRTRRIGRYYTELHFPVLTYV